MKSMTNAKLNLDQTDKTIVSLVKKSGANGCRLADIVAAFNGKPSKAAVTRRVLILNADGVLNVVRSPGRFMVYPLEVA